MVEHLFTVEDFIDDNLEVKWEGTINDSNLIFTNKTDKEIVIEFMNNLDDVIIKPNDTKSISNLLMFDYEDAILKGSFNYSMGV